VIEASRVDMIRQIVEHPKRIEREMPAARLLKLGVRQT
jgi:hypothetical protein